MKAAVIVLLVSVALAQGQLQWLRDSAKFVKDAAQGSYDMGRAYFHMREAETIGADKYFHARGNYDAAKRGPGGAWAAKVISDARELSNTRGSGHGLEDSMADQEANRWGRNGGDPNRYRPHNLAAKY